MKEAQFTERVTKLGDVLVNAEAPIAERMRTCFLLKQAAGNDLPEDAAQQAIAQLARAFDGSDSVLLKHEVAYVMGQLRNTAAIPALARVLKDTSRNCIVRHEAAEALGAISGDEAKQLLADFVDDDAIEVAQTARLAMRGLEFCACQTKAPSLFNSVDPAPPLPAAELSQLRESLLDTSASLFDRYRAMFALRDTMQSDAALALCDGLRDESALFRHEIAYVLGQMMQASAVPALLLRLRDLEEHPMVRHEAAEALGSIAIDEVRSELELFRNDKDRVVAESCDVALDLAEYWTSQEVSTFDEA
ncbi:MAG: hypothetical protein MHM6MM_003875 [Cercozoa sp. M6MM]